MLLTVVTFLPALATLLVSSLPRGRPELVKATAFAVTAATFLASVPLYLRFDPASAGYQFVEQHAWMPSLGISYHVGIDGISLLLVLLTTFLMPLTLLSAWHAIESRWKEFAITMLLLETGMLGVFVALDLFLFYVFWEAMLIPMYLVIGIWGGGNRVYAAIKFGLYTLAGSLLILAAVLLKMGTYGFLRFCLPLFPQASLLFAPWMFLLAVIGIIYGAWVSTVQPDIKKLVAYSSVSHLGFVVLGLFTLTAPGIVG